VAGLVQPGSGMFAIAHWQAVTIARWLRQWETAPERAAQVWDRHRHEPQRRYTNVKVPDSGRHWFELDHVVYLRALQRTIDEVEAAR
jgi:hypothetical protein